MATPLFDLSGGELIVEGRTVSQVSGGRVVKCRNDGVVRVR
jgi:hypothetical protein